LKALAAKLIWISGITTIICKEFRRLQSRFIEVLKARFTKKDAEVKTAIEVPKAYPDPLRS